MFNPSKHIVPFVQINHYADETGYIVWRNGTGDNTELLHITSYELRKGHGVRLVARMLEQLKQHPPYETVFGFTRTCNEVAHKFYTHLGFVLSLVSGVYKDGNAVVFSQSYTKLCQRVAELTNEPGTLLRGEG